MKGIVIGDCHFCDSVPIRRKDNFLPAQFRKLDNLKQIILKEGYVDGVFLLGDVFDVHSPDIWLVNEVIRKFNEIRFCVPDLEIPIYSIVGNHCIHGKVSGVHEVALGTLFSSGVVRRLQGDAKLHGIDVRGIDYTVSHTPDLYKSSIPRIVFSHNMITPSNVLFEHILAKDISAVVTNSVIFAGHYHPPFKYFNPRTKTHVINPGVMIRTDIAEKQFDPSVIVFNANPTTTGFNFDYKVVSLGADKGDDVFNVEEYKKEKSDELNLQQFIESIKNNQFQAGDIEQLIRDIGLTANVEDNVVLQCISRIKSAKASV